MYMYMQMYASYRCAAQEIQGSTPVIQEIHTCTCFAVAREESLQNAFANPTVES